MTASVSWLVVVETQPLFINPTADELSWVYGEPQVNEYFTGDDKDGPRDNSHIKYELGQWQHLMVTV